MAGWKSASSMESRVEEGATVGERPWEDRPVIFKEEKKRMSGGQGGLQRGMERSEMENEGVSWMSFPLLLVPVR